MTSEQIVHRLKCITEARRLLCEDNFPSAESPLMPRVRSILRAEETYLLSKANELNLLTFKVSSP